MYSTHTTFETYGDLKSFQTATSFQPGSSLSFAYYFGFLLCLVPNIFETQEDKLLSCKNNKTLEE
jgi:hypothetical protein